MRPRRTRTPVSSGVGGGKGGKRAGRASSLTISAGKAKRFLPNGKSTKGLSCGFGEFDGSGISVTGIWFLVSRFSNSSRGRFMRRIGGCEHVQFLQCGKLSFAEQGRRIQ